MTSTSRGRRDVVRHRSAIMGFIQQRLRSVARVGDTHRVPRRGRSDKPGRLAGPRNGQPERRWTSALSSLIRPGPCVRTPQQERHRPPDRNTCITSTAATAIASSPAWHWAPPRRRAPPPRPPTTRASLATSPPGARSAPPPQATSSNRLPPVLTGTGRRSRSPPGRVLVGKVRFQLRMCPVDAGSGGQALTDAPEEVRQ
jgi:hypothetical protein